jgi:hypothetical protein
VRVLLKSRAHRTLSAKPCTNTARWLRRWRTCHYLLCQCRPTAISLVRWRS